MGEIRLAVRNIPNPASALMLPKSLMQFQSGRRSWNMSWGHSSFRRSWRSAALQEPDLQSIRSDAKKQYKKRRQYAKRNLLEREFSAERLNPMWGSNITYFMGNDDWRYFCIILYLYAGRIVGYRISRNVSTNLVTAAFWNAYQERGKPRHLTFHGDRGKQYTCAVFTQLLQKNGVNQSFSATGRPHDNAVAETFFAAFKKRGIPQRVYLKTKFLKKCWAIYSILQWGSVGLNTKIPDAPGCRGEVLCRIYRKRVFK